MGFLTSFVKNGEIRASFTLLQNNSGTRDFAFSEN